MAIKEKIKSYKHSKIKDMRLDTFISKALNSYYGFKKPIGKTKDFITSPEISQMFGEIIGLYIYHIWKTKINSKFNLIELGPGKGTLFEDINRSVSKYPDFINKAKISFIEVNRELIKIQKKSIKKLNYNNVNWRNSINFKTNIPSIIYSNEFFDCFPVRQFILRENWFEKFVSFNNINNNYYFKEKKVTDKKLLCLLKKYKKEKILEVSFDRNKYFEKICKLIKKNGGLFLTIDYGYLKNNNNFTLQSIQNHKFTNVLENIGDQDVSSHVNFEDLINIAINSKLKIDDFCSQKEFLIKYGILERKKNLSKSSNLINHKLINLELNRLINNKEMGELFKFLIVSNL